MSRISKKQKKSLADVLPLSSVLEVVIREELRDFVIQQGMSALTRILEEERTLLCGAPYERGSKPARRAGSAPGQLVMGGRKVRVKRPRVRNEDGELSLASYQQFSEDDPRRCGETDQGKPQSCGSVADVGLFARRLGELAVAEGDSAEAKKLFPKYLIQVPEQAHLAGRSALVIGGSTVRCSLQSGVAASG